MSSTRLPGKVFRPIKGVPMMMHQIARIRRMRNLSDVVVATSVESSDDELAEFLGHAGVNVFRGPLDDVAARFIGALDNNPCDIAVRLTADCPLIDPAVVDAAIDLHVEAGADYTSNVIERTFPRGLDCEVFNPDVLRNLYDQGLSDYEKEHVTVGIYSRPESFHLENLAGPTDRSDLRWTVDTPEDFEFAEWVYQQFDDHEFTSEDIYQILDAHPEKTHREPQ
jgi:spore coat polysaccharide biosynthesis protein SpsF